MSKDDDFKIIKTISENSEVTLVRLQHLWKNIPVENSQYNLHILDNTIITMNGVLHKANLSNVDPLLAENDALDAALKYVNADSYMWESKEMELLIKENRRDSLATYFPKGLLVILSEKNVDSVQLAYRFEVFQEYHLNTRKYMLMLDQER